MGMVSLPCVFRIPSIWVCSARPALSLITQSEITDFLKPRFPLPFNHLANENEWCLLTIASKRLADFGSKEPKGADFGTVVGGQKGTAIIDKVIYLGKYHTVLPPFAIAVC